MEKKEIVDEKGRKYLAFSDDQERNIIIGPPEDLVDSLGLPEPFATALHNALYARKIYNYSDASKSQNNLVGVMQEVLMLDVQILLTAYYNSEKA